MGLLGGEGSGQSGRFCIYRGAEPAGRFVRNFAVKMPYRLERDVGGMENWAPVDPLCGRRLGPTAVS